MTDYRNDPNNDDKRLKQDNYERKEIAKGSTGILIGGFIVLIGIIAGVYLYNRDVNETTADMVNQQHNQNAQAVQTAQPVVPATATTPQSAAPADTSTTSTVPPAPDTAE